MNMSRNRNNSNDRIVAIIAFPIAILIILFIYGQMCPTFINSTTNPEGVQALDRACSIVLNYYPELLKPENLFGR